MDPPKLGSFDRSLLKSEGRKFLAKSAHPPCCGSPSKLQRHFVQVLAIKKQIANGGMKIHLAEGIGSFFVCRRRRRIRK
jgi:hypothetical protein